MKYFILFIITCTALALSAQVDIVDVYTAHERTDPRNYGHGAVRVLVEAERLGQQGRWQEAVLEYNTAVEAWPNWAPLFLKRANALLRMGRVTEAEADLERAAKRSPNSVVLFSVDNPVRKFPLLAKITAHAQTGHPAAEVYQLQRDGELFSVDLLLDELEAAGTLPDTELALLRGNQRFLQEDPLEAIAYYDWAINRGTTPELLYNRGLARISIFNFPDGCADLEEAERLGYGPATAQRADLCSF